MSAAAAHVPRPRRKQPADESRRLDGAEARPAPSASLQRGISFGVLAMLPLFVGYEIALAASGTGSHNAAEYALTWPLRPFGDYAPLARLLVLLLIAGVCAYRCFHSELGLVARIGRVITEGFVAAVVLGPVLLLLQTVFALPIPALGAHGHTVPDLAQGVYHVSGAAFEEIVFRVGLQSAFFVLVLQVALFFSEHERGSRIFAEIGSIVLGAFVFAAAHLAPVVGLFAAGGEPFDAAIFAWRFLAGVMLGVLFRMRGPGVAAWTHAFFNLALFVGAGPDVFL